MWFMWTLVIQTHNAFVQQRHTERRPVPQCLNRLLEFIVMCNYVKSEKALPYPRLAYKSECGFMLAVMEGFEFDSHENSNGTQRFSVRSNRVALPKGKCMKCGNIITNT